MNRSPLKVLPALAAALGLSLIGCSSGAPVGGKWNVTISVQEQGSDPNRFSESYPGSLEMSQFFSNVDGDGEVLGPGGKDCRQSFVIEGRSFDETNIPVNISFTGNDCNYAGVLSDDIALNLSLSDDGTLLSGHGAYEAKIDGTPAEVILYFSASEAPY